MSCSCEACRREEAMKKKWRARGPGSVELPAWFFVRGAGVMCCRDPHETAGLDWTHWMPRIDDEEPAPPDFGVFSMPLHRAEVQATIYSPLRIEILLHCAVSPWQNPIPNFEAPGVQEEVQDLLTAGAIVQKDTRNFEATPLGRAWVAALCNVPIPRVAYLDSHGQELEVR